MRLIVALGEHRAEDGIVRIDAIAPPGMIGGVDMTVPPDMKR